MSRQTTARADMTPGTRKGEEIVKDEGKEPGRKDTGTTGAGRPPGNRPGATRAPSTPTDPIDPKSPDMPPA